MMYSSRAPAACECALSRLLILAVPLLTAGLMASCGGAGSLPPAEQNAESDDGRAHASRAVVVPTSIQEEPTSIYSEAGKLVRTDESLKVLGNELFGDRVGLYTGSLEFVQDDVSVPGNSPLPVAVARRLSADPGGSGTQGHFGDWDLEIPRVHGVFSKSQGWTAGNLGGADRTKRCTYFGPPALVGNTRNGFFGPEEYWHGSFIYVPGHGSNEILGRLAGVPSASPSDGQTYHLTTKDRWMIRCVPLQVGDGEGFIAVSPEGTKYVFDRMVSRPYRWLWKGDPEPTRAAAPDESGAGTAPQRVPGGFTLQRQEFWILPSSVTDRHGNTVTYRYDATNPWRLLSIEGSEGATPRFLSFAYDGASNRVASVTSGLRRWTYAYTYTPSGDRYLLSSVTRPDASRWSYNLGELSFGAEITTGRGAGCHEGVFVNTAVVRSGSMTHPSGASSTFVVKPTAHGRSHVEQICYGAPGWDEWSYYPKDTPAFSVVSKSVTNLNLGTANWTYDYGPANASYAPCAGCPDTKTVTVTSPTGVTRYTFGNRFNATEGQLQRIDEGWDGSQALRTITRQYRSPAGAAWPDPIGLSAQRRGNGDLASRHAPEYQKVVVQQGVTFSWEASAFDQFAKPTDVTRSSSLGWSRRELTVYNHNLGKWVLSQPETVTDYATGAVVERNTYHPVTANRIGKYAFGHLQEATDYLGDGTVATRTDALNRTTVLTNYKRGVARNAAYADGSGESATVNDDGTIASVTNAAGTTTSYGYDAGGRLSLITYPGGDPVTYHPTVLTYEQMGSSAYGVSAGHWRLTRTTGQARTTTDFDGLWRPVMTRTWDADNEGGTRRVNITRYDSGGRKVFESYPQRDIGSVGDSVAGTTTSYDALDRQTQHVAASELGNLTTVTDYLGGFQRRTTNPRGYQTTHSFQVFDEPHEDGITAISAPEGVAVGISRDHFGKALSITRSGGGKSVTRSYVYDSGQRLCKTVEPETGATVQAYHGESELVGWRASGQNLPNTNACDHAAVPGSAKVNFSYTLRNQLQDTTYNDGSQNISRTYTPDGLLQRIVAGDASNPITWVYTYNNRRLLTKEQYAWWAGDISPSAGWVFTHGIDAGGHVSSVGDPFGTVTYDPNALGQPKQVSGFASGVSYHPNGAVAGYSLANGISHTVSLNARGLPELWRYSGVVSDRYAYDPNGNVNGITDEQEGANRSMPLYDGLDRLRQANGPWGAGSFSYDALDNLTSSSVDGRSLSHNIDATTNRLVSLTGTQNLAISYDANGNISGRGSQAFVFDTGNRMRSAVGKATYIYDGHGRRGLIWYAGPGGDHKHQAYTKDGKLRFEYRLGQGYKRNVYLGDKLIAEVANWGEVTTFVHADALGSPAAKTNAGGGLVSRTRYEPYGATVAGSTNPNGIGFTGHVNDPETGLVYMQQRYYEPLAGRFLSVDPVVTDRDSGRNFNRYVYGNDNPYKYVDPDGRLGLPVVLGGAALGGLLIANCDHCKNLIGQQLASAARGAGQLLNRIFNQSSSEDGARSSGAKDAPTTPTDRPTQEWIYGPKDDPKVNPDGSTKPNTWTTPDKYTDRATAQDKLDPFKPAEGRRPANIPAGTDVKRGTTPGGEGPYKGAGGAKETLVPGGLPAGSVGPWEPLQ